MIKKLKNKLLLSFLFFTAMCNSQQLGIKDIDKIRNSSDEVARVFLNDLGWDFLETMKNGKIKLYGFVENDKPLAGVMIGKEKHLLNQGVVYLTDRKEYYDYLVNELQGSDVDKLETISKKNKTVQFYSYNNSVFCVKTSEQKKFEIQICSKEDYKRMLEKI